MILLRRLIGRSRGGFSVNIRLKIDFDSAPTGLDPMRAKRVPRPIRVPPRAALADEDYYAKPHLEAERKSSRPQQRRLSTFKRQAEALALHAAAKTGKASVGADDAVARDDDGDSIASVRRADRGAPIMAAISP
jgi:hypothetical protein